MNRDTLIEMAQAIRTKSSEHEDYDPDLEVTSDAQEIAMAILEFLNVLDSDGKETEPSVFCRDCGSSDVQHAAWVHENTGEVFEHFGTWNCLGMGYTFCADCEEDDVELISEASTDFEAWKASMQEGED